MSNRSIKFKGRLRNYLCSPLYLIGVLVLLNIPFYFIDTRAGICMSGFAGIYTIIVVVTYYRNKPLLVNELVNFATQYGSVQKKLLNEFEIAYALLDYNGKLLWVNEQFEQMTGKDKSYHKSITSLFPSITKELLQSEETLELNLPMGEQHLRISMSRIYFDAIISEANIVEMDSDQNYLTAVYFFDETELNRYIQENEDQKMVVAQVYIDNYDEALESIEDVKRSLLVALIDRKVNKKEGSYTTYLFEKGIDKILKKVGEECTEVIIGAKGGDKAETVFEIADLLYHITVMMIEMGISVDDVTKELAKRHVVDHKVKQEKMQ